MVLFKRKPVQYVSQPEMLEEDTEVWHIPQTEEIFVDYEEYLKRMDFYKQTRFICQITGHSGLTFFDALKSELAGAQEVEEAFPEALKGPILRRVQFQTISRIDTLVDLIYEEFRADYYPGETVTVHVLSGDKLQGMVRDKTRFGAHMSKDGMMVPPFSRYFVTLTDRPGEEAVVDDMHIARDRKIFTKQVLRSFIKKTVTREAWTGAPWLVRKEVADQYHIDQRIPPHLRYESKAAERKAKAQQQRNANQPQPDFDGMVGSFPGGGAGAKYPELKPAPKGPKGKSQQQNPQLAKSKQQPFLASDHTIHGHAHASQSSPFLYNTFQLPQFSFYVPPIAYQQTAGPAFATFHNGSFTLSPAQAPTPQPPPPPPPIKYPIEDLQVAPRPDGPKRPPLKFFSQDRPDETNKSLEGNGIMMKSVGLLLETWDTLNVYCDVFKLDSFTFDDFVEAMQFSSADTDCELFVEIHCATLKMLVDSEADEGAVKVTLLGMSEDEEEEEDEDDIDEVPTPSPEPEPIPVARATRSSLAKAEAAALKAEQEAKEATPEPKIPHRAAEMQGDVKWIDRLRARDFKNGGWQSIVVGVLYQLSKNPFFTESCETILKELAPLDMPPTVETTRTQYTKLDVNLRIKALQTLTILTAQTKAIRTAMDDCSDAMTGYRKEKIEYQRDRKQLLEELRLLNEERKIQLPANLPPSPVFENKQLDIKMLDAEDEVQESIDEMDTEEDAPQGRALRRGNDRAADRKRKRDADQEKKEKAEAESKAPKQTKQFIKLMKDIQKKQDKIKECEEQIAVLDNDLREADCPRTRVLGKDRYWNRYYWFERNGMPYAGLPDSSTAEAGYANGCLWVQGPDDLEREGYIDLKPEWQQEYVQKFNMTVPERRRMEEGDTSVFTAHQWGYFDDPASVDDLVSWLDVRGVNEKALIKELTNYRDRIVKHMEKRKEYLNPSEDSKSVDSSGPPTKRVSTRKKEPSVELVTLRCMQWRNTTALDDLGHLHSEQPRTRRPTKKAMAPPPPVVVVEEVVPRSTRGESKAKRGRR